jgi:hypothetical protein
MNEIDQLKEYHMSAWGAIMVNFAIYGALLFWIRRVCLVRAERWLGRLEAEDATRDNVKEEAERGEKSDESEVLGAQSVV